MISMLSILLFTLLIPSMYGSKAALKLTFTPDEKYYTIGNVVEIQCELINPNDHTDSPQLWHIDLKTHRNTPISRDLLNAPTDDVLDYFKHNKQKRLEYVKKNHLRIRQILVEDTARYECRCPDCEEQLPKQSKDLQVMKLAEPKWHIEPGWPIQENAKTTIKCTADDFYPYVSHQILRNHHKVNDDGKAVLPTSNTYPQKFSWEATVTPTAEWHNTTLKCTLIEGNHEQHATKVLDVLFTARFLKCDKEQYVNTSKDRATIECSYAGNPAPQLLWLRQTDEKPITLDSGITIETRDEHHGKYKSIVTFERDKLLATPLSTTTRAPNAAGETTAQPKIAVENYYQQLLNGGFLARLVSNTEVKDSRKITIVGTANQARSNPLGSSAREIIDHLATSILICSSCTLLALIQHH